MTLMRFFITVLTIFIFTACSVAQPGAMQWSTKSKKAIKYAEGSREALRQIDMQTGLPDYEAAMAMCDKAIAKDPNFIEAYMLKADYATSANRLPEAIAAYRKTLEINPNFTKTGFVYPELANL